MACPSEAGPASFRSTPQGPQSQIRCGGCTILLLYPQGASNVRCSQCGHISPVSIAGGPDSAQLVCSHCRMLLVYPRGAGTVQCSICQTLNPANQANQVAHIVCEGCRITLMYAYGAQSVKCAVCSHITNVPSSQLRLQTQTTNPVNTSMGPRTTVVVENPPSLDDDGNEVQNFAVGVKTEANTPLLSADVTTASINDAANDGYLSEKLTFFFRLCMKLETSMASSFHHALKIATLLALLCSASMTGDECQVDYLPEGIYIVRIWDIGHDVMNPPTWRGHVRLRADGCGVYTGDWLEYSDHFSAFYSTSTSLLTGGWFSEGNLFWGGINFRWDGVRLTGRWTWYGRNGTGYEEWFPVGEDYVVPPLPPQPSHENEYQGDL